MRSNAEALLNAEALQRAIFNSANFSSIATDAKGVIQIFNVGAERMLGYAAAEVVNLVTPADISDAEELLARATALSDELGTPIAAGFEALVFKASRGIEDIYELTYLRKDGTRVEAVVSVTALRDAANDIIGYLLIGTDNTARKQADEERKRLERALQQTNVELEAASRMKSEFLANMSHELRTPLNAIIGFSEVLKDGLVGELTTQQREFIGDIFGSGKHLLSLINDILDLSKVEAGKMSLDLEPIPLATLLANSLAIVREKATLRRIPLQMQIAPDVGAIMGDPRKIKQIVYNLLANAVKFTVDGGRVTIDAVGVGRDDVGRVSGPWAGRTFPFEDSAFERFLKISVTDSGMGMSALDLERLFRPFSQVDSGLARRFEGTGLGLALVKLLTELHGGTVAVESALEQGSRFTVWLPLRPVSGAAVVAANSERMFSAPPEDSTAPIALVVEADVKSAEVVRVQLEAEGFRVILAMSAAEAVELATRHRPALITLDIMLPETGGWELLSRLHQTPELQRIPVVIISIAADRHRGFALGAAAVMQKPVSRQDLYDALTNLQLLPNSERGALTVLIVDDDPLAVELIAVRLQGLATRILRAHGGREAIEIATRMLPDLVVLDLMMPDVNGFDVVTALELSADTASIPILVVTAKAMTDEDRGKLAGSVSAIMEKGSVGADQFVGEVRRAMSGRLAGA